MHAASADSGRPTGLASVGVGHLAWLVKAGKKRAHPTDRSLMIGHIFRIGSKIKHTQGRRTYTRAQNVCPGWPVYEVKQPQEKWACDFHDDAPPLSFQLQVAEVIF